MRIAAAYLLIALTVAALVCAWWISQRKARRSQHSVRYVIQTPDEAPEASVRLSREA